MSADANYKLTFVSAKLFVSFQIRSKFLLVTVRPVWNGIPVAEVGWWVDVGENVLGYVQHDAANSGRNDGASRQGMRRWHMLIKMLKLLFC